MAALSLGAVALTGCALGAERPIASVDEIPGAMLALSQQPAAWEMTLDVDLDLDEVADAAAALDALGMDGRTRPADMMAGLEEVRRVIDIARSLSLSGATDADGDRTVAFDVDGEPAVELATGGETTSGYMAMGTDPTALFDAEPLPIEFFLRVDGDRLGAFVAEVDDSLTTGQVEQWLSDLRADPAATISGIPGASFDDLTAELEAIPAEVREEAGLPDPATLAADIESLVDAAVSGDWFGIDGEFDVVGLMEDLGVTPEMLEQEWEAFGMEAPTEPLDPLAYQEAMWDAVTFRDLTTGEDGEATATLDVDLEALALGWGEVMAPYDTTGLFQQWVHEVEALDLPVLAGVGTVTLVGTRVTEIRLDLLRVGLAFAEHDVQRDADEVAAIREAVAGFETTRSAIVVTYTDHGQVPDLVDGIDATTLDASLLSSLAAMGVMMDMRMARDQPLPLDVGGVPGQQLVVPDEVTAASAPEGSPTRVS